MPAAASPERGTGDADMGGSRSKLTGEGNGHGTSRVPSAPCPQSSRFSAGGETTELLKAQSCFLKGRGRLPSHVHC